MCGIAGVYGGFDAETRSQLLNGLSGKLAHRGPDGRGTYNDATVGLVHTRLSIIDLSANGNQPQYNEDRSLVLVCNGEIYNYQEIRKQLIEKGHQFSSHSDCEVILHLYEENNNDLGKVLSQLTGMFAFALWDTKKKKLFIARDRVGIKPMYYCHDGKNLVFASEVKPIITTGLFDFTTDFTSLYEYFLLGSVPGPNTIYKEIKSLEPGNYITIEDGRLSSTIYWDIPSGPIRNITENQVQEELEALLSDIIKDHLVADVPVGTFLSAGVDSSLITAIAVEHHPGIFSFTASFPGEPEDEGIIAANTAARLKTTHHSFELKNNFFDDFTTQFKDIDQPFAISSALALGRISKLAKQNVKVVLSGDGADELFGGYNRHEFPKRPDFLKYIPVNLQNDVLKYGAKLTGKKSLEDLRKSLLISDANQFLHRISIEDAQVAVSMFSPDFAAQIDMHRFLNRIDQLFDRRNDKDKLNKVLYVDMKTTLVDEMLTKCDRMTMINGIEGRVPFLDHRLVEFAFSLPGDFKRKNGIGKIPLRKFLAKKLGNELAYRVKTGFNSPFQQWLTNDKATNEFVLANFEAARKIPFLDKNYLNGTIKDFKSRKPQSVYAVVCLSNFYKNLY